MRGKHGGLAKGERDVVYIKIGTGIGAGLILCRCGNCGCLEALAGGRSIEAADVGAGARHDDPVSAELLNGIGRLFTLQRLRRWINHDTPAGRPDIATEPVQPDTRTGS